MKTELSCKAKRKEEEEVEEEGGEEDITMTCSAQYCSVSAGAVSVVSTQIFNQKILTK